MKEGDDGMKESNLGPPRLEEMGEVRRCLWLGLKSECQGKEFEMPLPSTSTSAIPHCWTRPGPSFLELRSDTMLEPMKILSLECELICWVPVTLPVSLDSRTAWRDKGAWPRPSATTPEQHKGILSGSQSALESESVTRMCWLGIWWLVTKSDILALVVLVKRETRVESRPSIWGGEILGECLVWLWVWRHNRWNSHLLLCHSPASTTR